MMKGSNFDVIVVGAGAAGLTAAIGLARSGFTVAAVEAAPFPGAENWSGCVYFCENLVHPDILGPQGVEALAWERRLVERGFFACDGYSLLGMKYRDPQAFRHCYTVLRPIYDHHLAQVASGHGVALLSSTTVECLIRENGRIIGVCTNRGPLYADLVFLAEGDASHLVTREGYERFTDQREAPKFLQGIKQVIELPKGAIEKMFRVGPEEGVAYEMLLRNGTYRGQTVQLNMGGFVYTNRQSLSVGLVLPVDHLKEGFQGDPNLLMEWFLHLPALRPWLQDGKPGVFGAKLIRGGGARDIPNLIDAGLAIGGAASAIGIDFPYPNFTGPATAMGLLIARAACRIRAEGGGFSRDDLRRHYLEPLQQSHYWQDVEFLRNWPGYVKRTQVFFGRNLELVLGSAYVWTRPRRWFATKWINWLRLVLQVAGPGHWREMRNDMRHLLRALRLREVVSRPALGKLLLDGTVNALRDLAGSPRHNLPPAGTLRFHYSVAGGGEAVDHPPRMLRKWFRRMAPVLAGAARKVYVNDDTPLSAKLPSASQLLIRQFNMLDVLLAIVLGLAAGITGTFMVGWRRFVGFIRGHRTRTARGVYPRYTAAVQQVVELSSMASSAGPVWEDRLGQLAYLTTKASHIHMHWPRVLPEKDSVAHAGLWHVCPAHVYEVRRNAQGQVRVVVNFENCIKCETCWRAGDLVDWGRDGEQRFIYPVGSPALARLLDSVHAAGSARPALPRLLDHWQEPVGIMVDNLAEHQEELQRFVDRSEVAEINALLDKFEIKLAEFDAALAKEPRTVDRARAEHLEMLARYAQQLAVRIVEIVRGSALADCPHTGLVAAHKMLLDAASTLLAKVDERSRRTWDRHFAWAAADGRQLRFHHVVGLRRLLDMIGKTLPAPVAPEEVTRRWLGAEEQADFVSDKFSEWMARLDAAFPPTAWREIDRGAPLTPEQDALLRGLIAHVPLPDAADPALPPHAPMRKALLAELGRRDPSLAFRVASHLWARDLARLRMISSPLTQAAARWTRGDEWTCFAVVQAAELPEGKWRGQALFVPASGVHTLLLLIGDQLVLVAAEHAGLQIEPLPTLGLRGAGLCRVVFNGLVLPESRVTVDSARVQRVWQVLCAADLTSIAFGMADQLCRRAIAHATSRVQFPGLFHDEGARDTIGKFGAIKQMIAQMNARRYLIETLDHNLSPADFSAASAEQAGLVKAFVAEALGTSPGSISYNAGQVFGGTGYSEDDILSKFYRDASAWRYLGASNGEIYRGHGEQLLRSWQPDGRKLAALEQEAQLFDEVAQRKALQAELDGVRVLRSGLRNLVNDWQESSRKQAMLKKEVNGALLNPAAFAEFLEQLARQDAHLLAGKALLLRTHARMEHGHDSEVEAALLRVWLLEAGISFEETQTLLRQHFEMGDREGARPLVDPAAGLSVIAYQDYLATEGLYDSGDFLVKPVDPSQPRFVPEMIEADPVLANRDREIRELFTTHFGSLHGEGVPYERYIERQHRPDASDLDFCRKHGFFRMPIPPELGGVGGRKVEYYLVTTNAQRLADVAVSLTIQANTSIGTTPILLARDRDLPRAEKDLDTFLNDPAGQSAIQGRLEKLLRLLSSASPDRIEQVVKELHKRLQEAVFAGPVLRVLAHQFVRAWEQALAASLAMDLAALQSHLKDAIARWQAACANASQLRAELVRRREACDLLLRWIASGQISAFALTEASAGSDTARVATRARLRSVPVEAEPDGVLRFVPAGGKEVRHLLDARRLDFRSDGVYYRWSDWGEPALIRFDEYNYETDDPTGMRYYQHGSRTIQFTDIAQLRERDGRLWYDYWELTGAKMWITNGRMAGVFCLYAKTDEGITGFVVDRHAEGLIVGKDEAKMGQQGSPTNELALQGVRVPRENVLGLEGRGQVNALETLNVGRAGLAMSAMAQMAGIIEQSGAFAQEKYSGIPDWVAWRLERMEEDRFTAEALAYEVVGRFEHPGTRSVRMESAISKMLVSEFLHHIIELAEDIHGLAGQTQLHLIEKRKRDARILNIYEGTNEVQRFFVLKDLAAEIAPRWPSSHAQPLPSYLGQEALTLESQKGAFRKLIASAVEVFGQQIWQNPNLQANCFLLAEAAAWLKAYDSTLGRLAWLERQAFADEGAEPSSKIDLARRAAARCQRSVRLRLNQFDHELADLRRGYYGPEIRTAAMLFQRTAEVAASVPMVSRITQSLAVLVVLEPSPADVPHPRIEGGRLMEPYLTLNDADRAALETALRLRDRAAAPVTIQVVTVGPRGAAPILREALGLGVDRARLVLSDAEAISPDTAANALTALFREEAAFDLILGGAADVGNEEGIVARLTSEALGVPWAGRAAQVVVNKSDQETQALLMDSSCRRLRPFSLPAAAALEAGIPLRPFTTIGYLAGLARAVEVERWPKKITAREIHFKEGLQTGESDAAEEPLRQLTPQAAANLALSRIGLGGVRPPEFLPFDGPIEDVVQPSFQAGCIIAVVAADDQGRLQSTASSTLSAANLVASAEAGSVTALVVVSGGDDVQRRAVTQVLKVLECDIVLLVLTGQALEPAAKARYLRECWPNFDSRPHVIVGEPWAEDAFASLCRIDARSDPTAFRVRRMNLEAGQVFLESSRSRGKLRVQRTLTTEPRTTFWISLAPEAAVAARAGGGALAKQKAERWVPRPKRVYSRADLENLLHELQQGAGLVNLSDAEFIIDVGFGVGNRDGYEAVIEPLEKTLRMLGVKNLAVGGSRKVTEELHLLPVDRQIGQSGVSVNPQVLLAIGISGAPQHVGYIGARAMIVAFNRDPEAPLMTLNQRQARPLVYPVVGDLFETVPAFAAALEGLTSGRQRAETEAITASA